MDWKSAFIAALGGIGIGATSLVGAQQTIEVRPLTDRIVMVEVKEGTIRYHGRGQAKTQDEVIIAPLNAILAARPATYRLRSEDDPAYREGRAPTEVGRKTKGIAFAWYIDTWVDNRAVNTRPDHIKGHWLYLVLPEPMTSGKSYTLEMGPIGSPQTFRFDERQTRSEAVRVNNLGYAPWIPAKYGYVYHWLGDRGGLDLSAYEGKRFWLIETGTGREAFEGRIRLRRKADQAETNHPSDSPPHGNFQNADVYEADFSAFDRPGEYVLAVESIGTSFPFRIADDAYRTAYTAVARALYHNRSGIELKSPYTEYTRPAPHNPRLTPGFAGKLQYSTIRFQEWGSEGGDAERLRASFKGPLDVWGWYQDAGDWDSYPTHFRVPADLLLAFRLAPDNFADGDLNIPESGNGIPDIVDEAAWLARFGYRLRQELLAKGWGTGGIGMRIAGDAFGEDTPNNVGRGSWEDTDRFWAVSAEDPSSTFRYAAVAATLASALRSIGKADPERVDWEKEARESYAWAIANTKAGDENFDNLPRHRRFAAAALFVLTGEEKYEDDLRRFSADIQAQTMVREDDLFAPAFYVLNGKGDPELLGRMRQAILATAQDSLRAADQRALRMAGNLWFPLVAGQQTTPMAVELAVAYALTKDARYLAAMATTADYFLGTNSLGMTWISRVGPRYPEAVMHLDGWYSLHGRGVHPGIVPYGPWRKEADQGAGPWDVSWANPTTYPANDRWPGAERWFGNRNAPLNAEFTVHQNLGPAAAFYGLLLRPW